VDRDLFVPAGGDVHEEIRIEGLTKAYGAVHALRDVDLDLSGPDVVALVGDNGAGKSTLVGCLTGSVTPTRGRILIDGHEQRFHSPRDAQALGIQAVYQDLSLALDLTPVQNVFLGRELAARSPVRRVLGLLDRATMREVAATELSALAVTPASFDVPTASLSGGQRQAVALARALNSGRRMILLDEPTAALGVAQTRMVLDSIRSLRHRSIPVVLVSHNLQDVFEVSDRIVVLRRGRVVLDTRTVTTTPPQIVAAITGTYTDGGDRP
jgi:ABC-type sugar transport system ATPase subunit